eukprot:2750804-Rhodomonas_salina.5
MLGPGVPQRAGSPGPIACDRGQTVLLLVLRDQDGFRLAVTERLVLPLLALVLTPVPRRRALGRCQRCGCTPCFFGRRGRDS